MNMNHNDEQTKNKLRSQYLDLVKKGIDYQKKKDIKAFTANAIQAEIVAQQIQKISRKN